MSKLVIVESRGAAQHVIMNRPEKRNALNPELIGALGEAFAEAADDSSVHCLVLRGAGPVFSSGMDLGSLGQLAGQTEALRPFRRAALNVYNLLEEMKKPTIAEIQGACIGGAMELALACDLRTMANEALIGVPEVRLGLLPDLGGCSRLPAIVGVGNAKELIMTGKMIGAEEAHRIGLVNRIAHERELEGVTSELVNELLDCAPQAVGLAKGVIDMAAKPAMAATLETEVTSQQVLVASEDFAEGARAFLEKRQPEFVGR